LADVFVGEGILAAASFFSQRGEMILVDAAPRA
jgi:hypothetical protein